MCQDQTTTRPRCPASITLSEVSVRPTLKGCRSLHSRVGVTQQMSSKELLWGDRAVVRVRTREAKRSKTGEAKMSVYGTDSDE
jgi:hypothetical protein